MENRARAQGRSGGVSTSREPELVASLGAFAPEHEAPARARAGGTRTGPPAAVEHDPSLPDGAPFAVTLPLGQPPFAALQLFYAEEAVPRETELAALAAFAARAAHALRAGERSRDIELELERTRALLEVVGEAISISRSPTRSRRRSSASPTCSASNRSACTSTRRAVVAAAGRGLAKGHEEIAATPARRGARPVAGARRCSLETRALGAVARARSSVALPPRARQPPSRCRCRSARSRSACSSPFRADARIEESDVTLLDLARGAARGRGAERTAPRAGDRARKRCRRARVGAADLTPGERALRDLSVVRAEPVARDDLAAVTKTIVEVLGVDAAVIRVPDERGDQFVLARSTSPSPVSTTPSGRSSSARSRGRRGAGAAAPRRRDCPRLGGAHALLVPFLSKGSTAALLPIATADRAARRADDSVARSRRADRRRYARDRAHDRAAGRARDRQRTALSAAEAVRGDDAAVAAAARQAVGAGLEVGTVYESAAQVDVGGDVYDFLELADGRLAVVLGDVTGHGIEATADMAMAKFVFRSLAREHSEPRTSWRARTTSSSTRSPRQVHHDGVSDDRSRREVLCASAGHPEPRLVAPDGTVEGPSVRRARARDRCAAGVRAGASRAAGRRRRRALHRRCGRVTCGARAFGVDRLDAVLARARATPPQAIAEAVIEACRALPGGDLTDDCAVVVIRPREPPPAATDGHSSSAIAARRRGAGEHASRARGGSRGRRRPGRARHLARAASCTPSSGCRRTRSTWTRRSSYLRAARRRRASRREAAGVRVGGRRLRSPLRPDGARRPLDGVRRESPDACARSRRTCRARSAIPATALGVARFAWPRASTRAGAAALRAAMPARIPLLLARTRASVLSLHHDLCSRPRSRPPTATAAPVLAWTVNEPEMSAGSLGSASTRSFRTTRRWRWLH